MLAYEDTGRVYRDTRKRIKQAFKASRALDDVEVLQRQLLQSLHEDQQEILRRADYALPCKPGCSYCCHLRVEANAHEILLLHHAITTRVEASLRQSIEEKARHNARRIAAIGPEQHLVTNIPCALLVEDRCSLHEIRPLPCARYHSTELAACQRAHEDPVGHGDRRPILPEVDLQGGVVMQAMRDGLKQAGLDHRSYELNTALAQLLDDPGLAQRWRQGKPLFRTADPVNADQPAPAAPPGSAQ